MMIQWLNKPLIVLSLIGVTTFGVYINSINNGFHYDDQPTIVQNPAIRSLSNIPSFFLSKQGFSTDELFASPKHYRPVLLTSYAINYALDELNPPIYHLTNILLHIVSTFLVYFIVLKLTSHHLAASLSSLIYSLNPIHTEALNYISARSSLLSGFFYLLAFYSFIQFRLAQLERTKTYFNYYFLFLLAFLLSILSKEVSVTLPLMIVVYDLYYSLKYVKGSLRQFILAYVPLLLGLLFYLSLGHVDKMIWGILHGNGARDLGSHLLIQAKVTVQYLLLFLWPVELTPDHRILPADSIWDIWVLSSLGVIGVILFIVYRLLRTQSTEAKACSFGLLWFFITALPTILVPLNLLMQEHRIYIPTVGLALAMGVGLSVLIGRGVQSTSVIQDHSTITARRIGGIVLCAFMITAYGILIVRQNRIWKDDLTLWSYAASLPAAGFRAHVNLGTAYEREGRLELAIQSYEKALEIAPDFFATHYNIALVYQKLGKTGLAIVHYQAALQINPIFPTAYHGLGMAYITTGQPDPAKRAFEQVLKLDPSHLPSKSALGWLYVTQGFPDLAEPYFRQVLSVHPDSLRDRLGLATIYNQRHEFDRAIPEYERVLQADPDNMLAHYHLGLVYEELGQKEKAVRQYQAVLAIADKKGKQGETPVDLSLKRLRMIEKGS
ncbi:MAG: tetratricopeptide repeat protein [Nitrospira sp.]|nr:tetratricopeptide repeat protein [Nitrospira sp.]